MRKNAARKEIVKLNKLKKEIYNFSSIYSNYNKYLENIEKIQKLSSSIEYSNTFVSEDVNKMLKYLKDNKYICPETNKVLLDRNYNGTLASNNVSQNKKESTIDSSAILLKAFKDNSNNPDKKFSTCINDTLNNVVNNDTDKLSLGTILEEISGINQMW